MKRIAACVSAGTTCENRRADDGRGTINQRAAILPGNPDMPETTLTPVHDETPAHDAAPPEATATDAQLLDAFRSRNDEAAFEALVQRHGPMIMGTCRRVLGNVH